MNLFKRFSRFYNPPGTGLIEDQRPVKEQERDYHAEEIMTAVPVDWVEKDPSQWRKFPIFDQDGSGSCVGQTVAKLLGIENFVEEGKFVRFSARDIYSKRKYTMWPGMYTQRGMEIGYKQGVSLEQLMPSEGKGEQDMLYAGDRKTIDEQMALVGKGGNYISLPMRDFDMIAQVLARGKAVTLGCCFNKGDWATGEVKTAAGGSVCHLVAVVDFCFYKGKKALIFDNSWGEKWGFNGQGVLMEDQIGGLHNLAYYFEDLKNTWRDGKKPVDVPKHTFDRDLVFGERSDEIAILQEILSIEGVFPSNVDFTGYYGSITAEAVYAFQTKHQVASQADLDALAGKRVGPKTRTKLNELYG